MHIGRVHRGNKLFKCEICSKEFVDKSNSRKNSKPIHEEISFKCNICYDNFTQDGHLKKAYFKNSQRMDLYRIEQRRL